MNINIRKVLKRELWRKNLKEPFRGWYFKSCIRFWRAASGFRGTSELHEETCIDLWCGMVIVRIWRQLWWRNVFFQCQIDTWKNYSIDDFYEENRFCFILILFYSNCELLFQPFLLFVQSMQCSFKILAHRKLGQKHLGITTPQLFTEKAFR